MSPYCSSVIEANNGHVQKIRAIEKEATKNRVVSGPVIEKVDAVAYPRESLGEKHMHASLNYRSYGYNQVERDNQNDIYGYCGSRSSEFNNSDSDACSVGSCSVTIQSPNHYYSHVIPLPCKVTGTPCSDAESCYGSGSGSGSGSEGKSGLHLTKEVEASIHRLELHAYHCTLEALYASGPLSWDKEALLTNLRIMLHISNDEHLMELKYLISTKTGPQLEACFDCFQRLNDDVRVFRISLGTNCWTIQSSTFITDFTNLRPVSGISI
ncbi:Plant Tudor-like RNA-binding protein [Abeliophyllum distichum]|uniref:Plant Tudor-like RNA-binding protein n=1 Tax=Abeliophyllum distichum TaxID=126358 RepID=A0ABD1TYI3_9LAMI